MSNILFQKPISWQLGGELLYTDERNRLVRIAPGASQARRAFLIGGVFGKCYHRRKRRICSIPRAAIAPPCFSRRRFRRSRGEETFYLCARRLTQAYYKSVGSTVLAGRVRAATIQGASK